LLKFKKECFFGDNEAKNFKINKYTDYMDREKSIEVFVKLVLFIMIYKPN
jgi:hypothetical protein